MAFLGAKDLIGIGYNRDGFPNKEQDLFLGFKKVKAGFPTEVGPHLDFWWINCPKYRDLKQHCDTTRF